MESTAQKLETVFNGIVSEIESLDQIISNMTSASQEQSIGVSEVNRAVTQLDRVTQDNAASASTNAHSVQEMNDQVEALLGVVQELQTVVSGDGSGSTGYEVASDGFEKLEAKETRQISRGGAVKRLVQENTRRSSGGKSKATKSTKGSDDDAGFPMPGDSAGSKPSSKGGSKSKRGDESAFEAAFKDF